MAAGLYAHIELPSVVRLFLATGSNQYPVATLTNRIVSAFSISNCELHINTKPDLRWTL